MRYIVVYPHPSILPEKRGRPCKADAETYTSDLLEQLVTAYPKHSGDLKDATFWQAGHSLVAQLLS